jgi:hypothetical protein
MNKLFIFLAGSFFLLSAGVCDAQSKIVDVNPLTGAGTVAIPLYNLNKGGVSLPVTLIYNGSGIKTRDVEGTGGMGWNVQAGGQISRQVRGLPDDCTADSALNVRSGWLYSNTSSLITGFTIANTTNNCSNELADLDYINNDFSYQNDTEPDVFYVSAPGLSCQFVFDGSQNIRLLNYQDLVVTYTHSTGTGTLKGAITSFTITNDRGIKYVFSYPETVTEKTVSTAGSIGVKYFTNTFSQYQKSIEYFNNWHLTSMTDANGNGFLLKYALGSPTISVDSVNLFTGASGATKAYQYYISTSSTPRLLSSIVMSDNDALQVGDGDAFQPITFSWTANTFQNGWVVTNQPFVIGITGLGKNLQFSYSPVIYKRSGTISSARYFLRSLTDAGCGTPVNYSFSYFGETNNSGNYTTTLSDSTAYADAWGYYNSLPNQTHIPSLYVNPSNTALQRYQVWNTNSHGSDYSVLLSSTWPYADAANVMAGSLTGITYAQGGSTTITYESNDYLDVPAGVTVQGGGIRVKQITDYDNISTANNIVRNYSYVVPSGITNAGFSSGKPVSLPVFGFTTPYGGTATGTNLWNAATMRSENDLSPEDHSIMYEYVTESQTGAGSTRYQFYVPAMNWTNSATPDCNGCTTADWAPTTDRTARPGCTSTLYGPVNNDFDTYPFAPNPNYDFERGLIKQVTNYNNNATPLEVGETDYTYQRTGTPVAITAFKYDNNTNSSGSAVMGYAKYTINTGTSELTSSVTKKIYDSGNLGQLQTTTSNYTYNAAQHKLMQEQVINSDNTTYTTNIKYTKDYTATGTNPDVVAIANLQLQNVNVPVETYEQVTRSGGSANTVSGALTRFQTLTQNGYTITVPLQQLKFISPNGDPNFTPYTITGGVPAYYQGVSGAIGYLPVANYTSYDLSGQLQTTDNNYHQEQTVFTDHYSYRPVAVFKNALASEVGYSDFDSDLTAFGPTFTLSTIPSSYTTGHTGQAAALPAGMVMTRSLTKNPGAQNEIFSVWLNSSATSGSFTVTLTPSSGTASTYTEYYTCTAGAWTYYECKVPVTNMTAAFTAGITTNQAVSLDDIMIYPDDAEVSTYAYDKTAFYKIAETNTNGVSAYFTNDQWGRVLYAYDQDRNIVQRNSYIPPVATSAYPAPTISVTPASAITTTTAVVFSTTAITSDPCTVPGITYSWNFGDGTPVALTATTSSPSHTYATAGMYTATLTVNSLYFGAKSVSMSVTVLSPVVTLSYNNYTTSHGSVSSVTFAGNSTYTFTAAQLSGATIPKGNYTITVSISGGTLYNHANGIGYDSVTLTGDTTYSSCQAFSSTNTYSFSANLSAINALNIAVNTTACGAD